MPTLDFKGKQHIYAHHLAVPYRPLIPDVGKSVKRDTGNGAPAATHDDNLIIHGDNLHALKALLPRYAGRVKCIYIDPPYNTGNEGWVYNDKVNSPLMRQWLKDNGAVDGEDLERHDKWLCMMWPRLHLLRELLADDGVIFVSIDDNELHHLRMLMDEIFDEDNFRNEISVRRYDKNISNQFTQNGMKSLSVGFERVLIYSKTNDSLFNPVYRASSDARQNYGYWKGFHNSADRPSMRYELLGVIPTNGQWKWQERVAAEAVSNYDEYLEHHSDTSLEDYWVSTGKQKRFIRRRQHLTRGQNKGVEHWIPPSDGILLSSNWSDILASERDLNALGLEFDNSKNTDFIKRLMEMGTDDDSLVLDSFAGSGTTAHAVLALNNEDGGNRKFILVECEDYADNITAERVRRVINGIPTARDKALQEGLGGSFTYCELGEPIEAESMLTGEALPSYSALAAYLLHTATGASVGQSELAPQDDDGYFHTIDETAFYLLYKDNLEWLCSNAGMLTAERAKRIGDAVSASAHAKRAIVFAPGKYIGQRELTAQRITFCQIPYEMHRAAGAL